MGPEQILLLQVRVDLGIIAMKKYSKFPKTLAGASPSDGLVSYPGHSLGWGSYLPEEIQLIYSIAPAN